VGVNTANKCAAVGLKKKLLYPRDLTGFPDEMDEHSDRLPHMTPPNTGSAFNPNNVLRPRVMALFHRAN
jgi:hypothetical protein